MGPGLQPRRNGAGMKPEPARQPSGCIPSRADEHLLEEEDVRIQAREALRHPFQTSGIGSLVLPGIEGDQPHLP
jgi:hypothetical protein